MLRVRVDEVCLPSLTVRVQFVKKYKIQLHVCAFSPRWYSFVISLLGIIVLKAEL